MLGSFGILSVTRGHKGEYLSMPMQVIHLITSAQALACPWIVLSLLPISRKNYNLYLIFYTADQFYHILPYDQTNQIIRNEKIIKICK